MIRLERICREWRGEYVRSGVDDSGLCFWHDQAIRPAVNFSAALEYASRSPCQHCSGGLTDTNVVWIHIRSGVA